MLLENVKFKNILIYPCLICGVRSILAVSTGAGVARVATGAARVTVVRMMLLMVTIWHGVYILVVGFVTIRTWRRLDGARVLVVRVAVVVMMTASTATTVVMMMIVVTTAASMVMMVVVMVSMLPVVVSVRWATTAVSAAVVMMMVVLWTRGERGCGLARLQRRRNKHVRLDWLN